MRRFARPAVVVAVVGANVPAPARAEALTHGSLSLEWQSPAECPNPSAVLERVKSLLSASPESSEPVQARGTVLQAADGSWQLALETTQREGTFRRSVQAGSCDEVAEAGALIVALALDPNLDTKALAEPEPVAPSQPEPVDPPPETTPSAPAAPKPKRQLDQVPPSERQIPAPTGDLRWIVAGSAVGDLGTLPRAALGAQLALSLELTSIGVEVLGSFFPAVRHEVRVDRGGDVSLLAGGLRACYGAAAQTLHARLCAGGELGQILGSGVGAGADESWNQTRSELWLAGRAGAFAAYRPWSQLGVRLGLEAAVPATRPKFVLQNVAPVHQPAQVVGRLEIGLEAAF